MVETAVEIDGRIEVLCTNAAYLGTGHAALNAEGEAWERSFAVTLLGAQHFTQAVPPYTIQQKAR